MALEKHRDILKRAHGFVGHVRGQHAEMQRKLAEIASQGFTLATQNEHRQRIRSATKAEVTEPAKNLSAELAAALADRHRYTREAIVRRSTRFTAPAPADPILTSDRALVAMMADVRELLTAAHWRETAPQLTPAELMETFETELALRHFAICAAVLVEADRRADESRRTLPTATDEQVAAGVDVRALPHKLRTILDAAEMPEFVATETLFTDLQLVQGYLEDAVNALDTGDDAGVRREKIVELRRAGASNDEIRAAMQEMRA